LIKLRKQLKLNIGAGKDYKEGYVNIDQHSDNGADLIHVFPRIKLEWNEIEKDYWVVCEGSPLPYDDESVDEIFCSHFLEDFVYEFETIMQDFHRVLKEGGRLHIKVPYEQSYGSFYHKRFFDKNTFRGFVSQNFHYQDKGMFSEIIINKVNRYGLLTSIALFLLGRTKYKTQDKFWKKHYESPGKIDKIFNFIRKYDLRIGMRYEIEAILIK